MAIRSLFTSNERLFAEWIVHHKFNEEIQAEPFFLEESANIKLPTEKEKEFMAKARLKLLEGKKREAEKEPDVSLSDGSSSGFACVNIGKIVHKRNFTYKLEHCPVIQNVEKQNTATNKLYGDVWLKSHFQMTEKKTGSFLVDSWLVVSLPKKVKEESPFIINHDEINDEIYGSTEFSVTYRLDDNLDPVESKIAGYIKSWFESQSEKLLIASKTCAAGATLFTVVVSILGKSKHLADGLFGIALVISCIAMYAMSFYSGVKLYQLSYFKEEIDSGKNLGNWVQRVRSSANAYPDLVPFGSNVSKFFTPEERASMIITNMTANKKGYIRRFFQRVFN